MKPISREEMENLQGLMKTKRNNHYKKLISNIDSTNTLEQLKDVIIDYIEKFKLEQD
jgi:hypothetical protein